MTTVYNCKSSIIAKRIENKKTHNWVVLIKNQLKQRRVLKAGKTYCLFCHCCV